MRTPNLLVSLPSADSLRSHLPEGTRFARESLDATLLDSLPRCDESRDAARTPQQKVLQTSLRISAAGSGARKAPQRRSFDSAQDFGSRLGRRENASTQILRLRSGFRLAARTPRERLNFTKKRAQSVLPSGALMSLGLSADGLRTDWFNPSVSGPSSSPRQRRRRQKMATQEIKMGCDSVYIGCNPRPYWLRLRFWFGNAAVTAVTSVTSSN
jgi:hypothetical protein